MATSKKRTKAPTQTAPQPSPKAEKKRAYEALLALRRKMDSRAEDVAAAERFLRSARTITSSLEHRRLAMEEAEEALAFYKEAHAEAVRDFEAARSRS